MDTLATSCTLAEGDQRQARKRGGWDQSPIFIEWLVSAPWTRLGSGAAAWAQVPERVLRLESTRRKRTNASGGIREPALGAPAMSRQTNAALSPKDVNADLRDERYRPGYFCYVGGGIPALAEVAAARASRVQL